MTTAPIVQTGPTNRTVTQTPVVCPVCGGDYLHIVSMSRTGTPDEYGPEGFRGVVDWIYWNCEAGCEFATVFAFHKGNTFTWWEEVNR